MHTTELHSYNATIRYALEKALKLNQHLNTSSHTDKSIAGFWQLEGPTGGGKTSSLYMHPKGNNEEKPALETIKNIGLQTILVTHRWNILHDLYRNVVSNTDSAGKPFTASVLYAQDENIISAVTRNPLPHENGVLDSDLPDPYQSLMELDFPDEGIKNAIENSCRNVSKCAKHRSFLDDRNDAWSEQDRKDEDQKLSKACAAVENLLLKSMRLLENDEKKARQTHGKDHMLTIQAKAKLNKFRDHRWIRRIFPAITWRTEKQHLLIMTTQKMFSSFYDGKRKVRISSSDLAGHVLFIDEFDYQADVLQKLLSQSQLVQEPQECLKAILNGGKELLSRLERISDERPLMVQSRLSAYLANLESSLHKHNIDLSGSSALMMPPDHYQNQSKFNKYLFRSDHLITTSPLSLTHASGGFDVSECHYSVNQGSVDIGHFLRTTEKFILRFSQLIADVSAGEDEKQQLLRELYSAIFDPSNDFRPAHYSTVLDSAFRFSISGSDLPELKQLAKTNLLRNTQTSLYGLTCWLLKQSNSTVDPLRLQIRRAFMPTTPEGLIFSLASRNFVFALSATSYIERAIGHFDLRWICSALFYLAEARNPKVQTSFLGDQFIDRSEEWFKKPMPYVQTEEDFLFQQAMINRLIDKKSKVRGSRISIVVMPDETNQKEFDYDDVIGRLSPEFFSQGDRNTSSTAQEHRKNAFLSLLDVIRFAGCSEHLGHLAFVNSTRYLRHWLVDETAAHSREALSWFHMDENFYPQLPKHHILHSFYKNFIPVITHQKPSLLCLLTSECQKKPGFAQAYQAAFDSGRIVVVLTQTATATNGINLDYESPLTHQKMDLTCLHLLESQYYYFVRSDPENGDDPDGMAHAGYQLRNLEKLRRAGDLSEKQQRQYILPLMQSSDMGIKTINSEYLKSDDYIRNIAADVQQQVGRIERAWCPVPEIEIRVNAKVAMNLKRFTAMPLYDLHKDQISHLNLQLLEYLKTVESKRESFFTLMTTPSQTADEAKHIIDKKLVPALRAARDGHGRDDVLASLWRDLGRAVLQHDYAWKPIKNDFDINTPLKEWACIEKPDSESIWYTPDTWQFFTGHAQGRKRYAPEKLYHHIQRNHAICHWFGRHNFKISLIPVSNELESRIGFHPEVVQRILQGRLGEEAIRGLLDADGIKTSDKVYDTRVLELYDFSISNSVYRVDAKFWSRETMDTEDIHFGRWLDDGCPSDLVPMKITDKLQHIRKIEGADIRLAILNFVVEDDKGVLRGFTKDMKPAPPESADILFLSSCIHSKNSITTPAFARFVSLASSNSTNKE